MNISHVCIVLAIDAALKIQCRRQVNLVSKIDKSNAHPVVPSPFNKLLNFWEQEPFSRSQKHRDEKVTEELAAALITLDTSAVDE